jgi:hypothetical protein
VEQADRRGLSASWVLGALCAMLALGTPSVAAAAPVSPLPESDYTTHSACAAPAPGYASCLALELIPRTSAAAAHTHPLGMSRSRPLTSASAVEGSDGLRPQDLRDAYFPASTELPEAPASEPQTIALVDAYNDPDARSDLETYEREFGLGKCPVTANSCFEQVNEQGGHTLPFPENEAARETELGVCNSRHRTDEERAAACVRVEEAEAWAVETSTDIEVTRAVCQNCKILLVEASVASFPDLETAEETAVRLGATEISNSWDGPQEGASGHAFDHPDTVITAPAGDEGYLNWTEAEAAEKARREKQPTGYFAGANYPASSPDVVAVGGTKLTLEEGIRQYETVWNEDPDPEGGNEGAGGSGCSESFAAPPWQRAVPDWSEVGCGSRRAVADVSADADPYTGVAVYDSVPTVHEGPNGGLIYTPLEWAPIGGTSVASPIVAAMFALAGGSHGVQYPAQTLYSHLGSTSLHDVTVGGNGACDDDYTNCSGSLDPLSPLDCGKGVWICNTTTGYDGPTGVGTPAGIGAFEPKQEAGKEASPNIAPTGEGPSGDVKPGATGAGTGSPGATSTNTSSPPGGAKPLAPARISALTLTAYARDALRHSRLDSRLATSALAFSCVLNRPTSVKLTLAIQIRSAGRARWRTLSSSLTFAATQGINRRRLHGRSVLAPGTYRLTLTPVGGAARSLTIRVP